MLSEDMTKLKATDMFGRNVVQYASLSGSLALVAALASAPFTVPLDRYAKRHRKRTIWGPS